MSIKNFSLKLESGEVAKFTSVGDGPYIAYVVGPGSFYLKALSKLYPHITFVTCDEPWTRKKTDQPRDEKAVAEWTLEKMVQRDKSALKAIKSYYKCAKVALFGFSAPGGALGATEALTNSEDIACFVGTGVGLCKLDASFSTTTAAFNERATLERKERLAAAESNFDKVKNGEEGAIPLHNTNFVEEKADAKTRHKRTLTPNSVWVEATAALGPKMLAEDNKKGAGDIIDEHWRFNLNGEVLCQQAREHFFGKIQPNVDTVDLLKQQKVPTLLIQGKHDFVTPLDEKTAKELTACSHITLHEYPASAHMTYLEEPERYVASVLPFVKKHTPMKAASDTMSVAAGVLTLSEVKRELSHSTQMVDTSAETIHSTNIAGAKS